MGNHKQHNNNDKVQGANKPTPRNNLAHNGGCGLAIIRKFSDAQEIHLNKFPCFVQYYNFLVTNLALQRCSGFLCRQVRRLSYGLVLARRVLRIL